MAAIQVVDRTPSPERLLVDNVRPKVEAHRRFTRLIASTAPLADFAKIFVELFDAQVLLFEFAVTQQFNTTTSMGRLTLNILFVVCPVHPGGHLGAHPRQDRRLQAERSLGRRYGCCLVS